MGRVSRSRSLLAVAVAITMSLALGLPVAADLNLVPGESAHVAYTNGDGVNVRDFAGFEGAIVTALPEGYAVTVLDGPMWLDDGTAWFYVGVDGDGSYLEGWVIADYLSSEYIAPSTSVASVAATASTATVANTDGAGLRLRDGASLEAGIMSVMPEGSVVTVLASEIYDAAGDVWAQVDYAGTMGYASAAFLSIGGSAPEASAPVAEPVATEPVAETSSGFVAGDRAAVSWTDGGGLNLRAEGSYGSAVLTIVPEGNVVTILDGPYADAEGNGWYQVDYSSVVGWAHGGFLAWTDQAPTADPGLSSVAQPVAEPVVEEPVVEEPVAEQPPVEQPVVEQPPAEQAPVEEVAVAAPVEEAPAAEPVAPETGIGAAIVAEALNYVGTPYVWGGTTPGGFDCSGFTYYVVNKVAGVGLSRSLEVQAVTGSYVGVDGLIAGDLVFFQNTYKWGLSHVGIYIGGGQFVHASSERVGTVISDVWDSYWGPRYYTARRVA